MRPINNREDCWFYKENGLTLNIKIGDMDDDRLLRTVKYIEDNFETWKRTRKISSWLNHFTSAHKVMLQEIVERGLIHLEYVPHEVEENNG